jgi:tRNA threonylcarbamoyladenosine biosynthesis protein TsaE
MKSKNQSHVKAQMISASADETVELARMIGERLQNGDVLALSGELGSGKTCFTGGLARGLGIDEKYRITSPTFTLINEYPGRFKLCHFDIYRIKDYGEFEDLGYEEYFNGEGVVVIEWAEKIAEILPETSLIIKFEYLNENGRKITVEGPAGRIKELIQDTKMEVV